MPQAMDGPIYMIMGIRMLQRQYFHDPETLSAIVGKILQDRERGGWDSVFGSGLTSPEGGTSTIMGVRPPVASPHSR
jgi:hypothetical protein